jgi:ribosomal-protein-alanine N-acetyltransferase
MTGTRASPSRTPPPQPLPADAITPTRAAVTIGGARLRELPAIAGVQRRAFPPRLAYTLGTLVVLWALPWVRLLVARRGEEIVGCVIGDRVIDGARIINLAVDPAARRQGIGTLLLHAVEQSLPGGDMTLMVQAENEPARALYHRLGYHDEARAAQYYGPGRAGIRMRKRR